MAGEYQNPGKCRFYIDTTNYMRAIGVIKNNQNFNNGTQPPCAVAQEGFGNNASRAWTNTGSLSWLSDSYSYTSDTGATIYYYDNAIKFDKYYPMPMVNYMFFIGHNFGNALTNVEPYLSSYDDNGLERTFDINNDELDRRTLLSSDINVDMDVDNIKFHRCGYDNDGKITFYTEVASEDENTEDERDFTGTSNGWSFVRWNDNNQSTDNFENLWNGITADAYGKYGVTRYNTMGFRFHEHEDGNHVPICNAMSVGTTYVLNGAPDLDLEMSWEYKGIDKKQGMMGQDFININYDRPAHWPISVRSKNSTGVSSSFSIKECANWWFHQSSYGDRPELHTNGRRVWKLKFSYMDAAGTISTHTAGFNVNDGLFSDNFHGQSAVMPWSSIGDNTTGSKVGFGGLKHDFYTRVIRGTMGGQLPFLFQPNVDDEDEIYLCEFESNSINFSQRAHKVWDVSLTIREVW